MRYAIIKFFTGKFELTYDDGKKVIRLTDEKPAVVVDEDDYVLISEKYLSMIANKMILVQRIEPKFEEIKMTEEEIEE